MKDDIASQRSLIRRQKFAVAGVVLAIFSFFLFINAAGFLLIKRLDILLEQSLDERLKTAASLTSRILENDLTDLNDPVQRALLRITLTQIRLEHHLEAAYLITAAGIVLLDSRMDLEGQTSRSYVLADSSQIHRAIGGETAVSQLNQVAGNYFKSVYVPLYPLTGSPAILVLEADVNYFRSIRLYRRGLWIAVLVSVMVLTLLTLFLVWATRLFVRTEEQLQQSRRLAALGQMAATVAHEIRNPLGIIKSTNDVLREKVNGTEQTHELYGYINEQVGRINRLVSDFLSLSREPSLDMRRIDLSKLVQETCAQFSQEHQSIELVTAIEPGIEIQGDGDRLAQVLLNLLINAAEATEQKQSPRIDLSLIRKRSHHQRTIAIAVSDNGPGLPASEKQVFEPFFTTKTQGTGLGLAVSRRIVERHGGTLSAANRSQGGTIFTLSLPMHPK
ncbi:GHKL domain-containing protein [candidate division KSB1 bacterium]|nr:GHKL domain-containing protein [candidate division KSB1 bacterium]